LENVAARHSAYRHLPAASTPVLVLQRISAEAEEAEANPDTGSGFC